MHAEAIPTRFRKRLRATLPLGKREKERTFAYSSKWLLIGQWVVFYRGVATIFAHQQTGIWHEHPWKSMASRSSSQTLAALPTNPRTKRQGRT